MTERRLRGKTAIITGGGRGIGAATAELFATEGANVVIAARTKSELDKVCSVVASVSDKVIAVPTDISNEVDVKRLFRLAREKFGQVDILVNNAGAISVERFMDVEKASWENTFAVNVTGTFLCSRELFRQVRDIGPKTTSIVNVSSLSGIRGTEKFKGFTSYIASKHAIVGMTESLSVEGREYGIRVNCVAPGAVDTVMLRQAAPDLKTNTKPADIARVLLYLSDEKQSAALTGSIIEVHSNL